MKELTETRNEINQIDKEMAELFCRRMDCAADVIAYKKANGLPIFDGAREQAVIEKNLSYIENKDYQGYYQDFITHLMGLSKSYQRKLNNANKVGYQGVEGAFSYIASTHLFPHEDKINFPTFQEVFQGVTDGSIAYGVLPLENSATGDVNDVLDLLFQYDCHVTAIYDLAIRQNLLGLKGAKISDIQQVYSHQQAIAQSKQFLNHYDFEIIPFANTALAAKLVQETGDIHKAAIASKETAALYDLEILAENINTANDNTTRFIVLEKDLRKKGNRFNLIFTVPHKAGQLANVIQTIGQNGFNLESIKSRPMPGCAWEYYFYVEIVGDINETGAQTLLQQLNEICQTLKVVGVYEK
ncbi:MAG: chorismate mutase [Peptococcaceae bacterium]|nr:chorismate mutase [Peptococcaceae bacterium]